MEKLLNGEIQEQLRKVFEDLKNDVTVALFLKEGECNSCEETQSFMEELVELSDKLHLKIYDLDKDQILAQSFKVEMAPSIVLLNDKEEYMGIKFNGIPAGHEINSFIPALLEVSGNLSDVTDELKTRVDKINKPVNIKVFVTLSCPHCPGAVQKAHKLALMNKNINAEMIEAQTFYDLSEKYNVSGVPKIVINDQYELLGNQPIDAFLREIEKI